jgi:hypothetical protein
LRLVGVKCAQRAGPWPLRDTAASNADWQRYYLLVNRKTAAQLGITVPTGILIRADEVIE